MNEILNTEESVQDLEQIGRKFRKQRKKKSLSIQEVSETLRIGEKILNGIEEGNVEEKIAPVFMRGFIRSYAKHLDLWDEAFEQSVSESSGLEKDRFNQTFPRNPVSSKKKLFIRNLAAVMVLIGGGYLLYVLFLVPDPIMEEAPVAKIPSKKENIITLQTESPKLYEEETLQPNESELQNLADSSPTGEEFQSEKSLHKELPETEEPITGPLQAVSLQSKPMGQTAVPSENEPVDSSEALVLVSDPLPPPMELIISSTERAWFTILMDDQEIIDVMLDAGESYELEAHERFLVTLGNTAALHLMFDGREIEFDRSKSLLKDWVIEANPSE